MSKLSISSSYFETKEQALAEIQKDGYWPVSWIDKPGADYEAHCHRDEETLYVVEGVLEFVDCKAGKTHLLRPGDKLFLPARHTHEARTSEGTTYIMGIKTLVHFDEHFLPPE